MNSNEIIIKLCTLLFLMPISILTPMNSRFIGVNPQKDSVVIENPYLIALHNRSIFGSANTENIGKRIIVALSDVDIKSGKKNSSLKRGNVAVFFADESYETPAGEYFEIALKKDHPPYKSPERWLEPEKNTIIFQDDQLRIFEERLAPHDQRPLHSHSQRLVVRLNLVQLTDPRFNQTAKPGTGIQVPNTLKFAEPVIHEVKNLSDIPLFNIVVEFNAPHN